jgi:hypothetical protein
MRKEEEEEKEEDEEEEEKGKPCNCFIHFLKILQMSLNLQTNFCLKKRKFHCIRVTSCVCFILEAEDAISGF